MQLPAHCDLVFVTTLDEAITEATESVPWRRGTAVVHCSGATEITTLARQARDGAEVGRFHPMQTFSSDPAAAVA